MAKFERNWNSIHQKAITKNCTDREYAYILCRHFKSKVIIENQILSTGFYVQTGDGDRYFMIRDVVNLVKDFEKI